MTAPPVDGRATDAVLRAVAGALGLRPRDVVLRTGTTSRDKLLQVTDPAVDLPARVVQLRDGWP